MIITQQGGGFQSLQKALWAMRQLTLYRVILDTPAIKCMQELLELIAVPGTSASRSVSFNLYHQFVNSLTENAWEIETPLTTDVWKELILEKALYTETLFSKWAARRPLAEMPVDIIEIARRDLDLLGYIYQIDARSLQLAVVQSCPGIPKLPGGLPSWSELIRPEPVEGQLPRSILSIKTALDGSAQWSEALSALASWYLCNGQGDECRYWAFKWTDGFFKGIKDPDIIPYSELTGYESQRQAALDNARRFIAGGTGNNVLLHGERGTGKSTTVKGLLTELGAAGLRMVELNRSDIGDLPKIFTLLRNRSRQYIVFIDDLSFETTETAYKSLKAAIEGSMEPRPKNVLIYATSNRRNLIKESFEERGQGSGSLGTSDVHAGDTLQEKLSLVDRFGLSILFLSPDQEGFVAMVRDMAKGRGLKNTGKSLTEQALLWARQHNGYSPRTARQFIDHISAG